VRKGFHVKSSRQASILTTAAALSVALLAPPPAHAQLPRDPVERARRIAEIRQTAARQLTLFDRQGKTLAVVGPRELYNRPVLSLDGKRVAVIKGDLDKETNDVWVLDVATGNGIPITATKAREGASSPVWSPDGSQVAYVRLAEGFFGLYRKASNGEGPEELLYRHNAPIDLTDWSLDGRFLSFFSTNLAGGGLFAVPVAGAGERKPIEIFSSKFQLRAPRISPDGRFVAYVSNPSGREEIYVRPFDPAAAVQAAAEASQVSDRGGIGMPIWRRDGKELYYLGANQAIMAVEVATAPTLKFSAPRVLFRLPEGIAVTATMSSVSRDGERVLIAVPPPQLVQMTVFDRQGQVVGRIGEPGTYAMPMLSPDSTRVAVLRNDRETGNRDVWAFDVASGKGTPITSDTPLDDMPVWSPDGKQIAYLSMRGADSSLYRKASDGTGQEELVFRYTAGTFMGLTDWSPDGKYLTFFTGMLAVLPLGSGAKPPDRKEIEWLREEYEVLLGRFSPDSRFLAYLSNEANVDVMEVYVRPFDATKPEAPGPGPAVQISKNGALGMLSWRQDGRELYYMTRDWEVMAVDVTTTPTFQAGPPRPLFKVAGPLPGAPGSYMTRDGQRFIIPMPATPTAPAR
jgi:Tol biopolymer transport system component